MKVLHKGHRYELDHRGGSGKTIIQYVNREPGHETEGVLTQEILRMLIDHTRYCNNCLPHPNNARIIKHFELALVLHEARVLERKVEKGEIAADQVAVGSDGHFALEDNLADRGETTDRLDPWKPDWERECAHQPAPVLDAEQLDGIKRRVLGVNETSKPYEPYLGPDFP